MDSVTHITGNRIEVGGRSIQRCSLCGEKLIDSKGCMAPIKPDGSPPDPIASWPVGRLVRVTPGNPTRSLLLDDTKQLPEDSCIALIED